MIYQYTKQKLIGYKFKNHTFSANEQQIDFFLKKNTNICTGRWYFDMKISISVKKLSVKSLILTISLSISSDTLWRDNSEFFKLYLLRKFKKYLIKEQDISHGCGQYAM